MIVWMVQDAETKRIALQATEPDEGSFPPGLRGSGWQIRRGEVAEDLWADLLSGGLHPDTQTALHQDLWTRQDASDD